MLATEETHTAAEDAVQRCARDVHCLEATAVRQDDGTYTRVPVQSYRAFCDADRSRIAECLAWLPDAYVELYLQLGDKGHRTADKITVSPYPQVPPNLEVDALMCEMVSILASWEERVRDLARLSEVDTEESRRRRGGVAMTTIRRILGGHLDALLALPPAPMFRTVSPDEDAPDDDQVALEELSGADAGLEILELHRRCRRMLGYTPQHQDLPVPCWNCDHKPVRRWDGSAGLEDEAHCSACGEVYSGERYRLLMGDVHAREVKKRRGREAS